MALTPCPECGRQVSSQAEACPGCGHPIREVEYCFVTVTESSNGYESGKGELEGLLQIRLEGRRSEGGVRGNLPRGREPS